jgi:CoA:oxalate CoA-transferase
LPESDPPQPAARPGPLSGVTVVDLSRVLAGPYCTMILADLGARVIKVEQPGVGDHARDLGPFVNGRSAYFASVNRGKESIALDLSSAPDRACFEQLLEMADVLVENFKPGTMDRLGYGWATVHRTWPRVVMASVSGFGQTGPYAQRPAYDMVAQAMGGIMSVTGHPGGEPTRVGTSIGDLTAALFAAVGIATALYDRAVSGVARRVDVAMLDCQVALLENALARYSTTGEVPGPLGGRHPSITPFAVFRAGQGTHLVIAAATSEQFARLCAVLGLEAVAADPRFASNRGRTEHHGALAESLESALAARPASDWLGLLEAAGVACGPINDVAAVMADPQIAARRMVMAVDDPAMGDLRVAGNPIKLSGLADPAVWPAAPELDADRASILAELDEWDEQRGA